MSSIHDWSKTAGDNDTADSAINWQENQFPSTVNNSARQMMGRVAELLDDLGAVTSTTNLTNAYSLTANSSFTALADGLIVGFKSSATNTGAATLNVNAIGSKAIRRIGATADVAIEASTIVTGRKYLAVYDAAANSAAGAWVLLNPTLGPASVVDALGFTPVQQGGGAGQGTNKVYIGWDSTNSVLKAQVDATDIGAVSFAAGTRIPFYQAAAPTGWTKVTGVDNRALRVVDGTGGGSGGSMGFTTAFAYRTSDAHTLTAAEMPWHGHSGSTGWQSHDHAHGFSGTTQGADRSLAHSHSVYGGVYGGTSESGVSSGGGNIAPVSLGGAVIGIGAAETPNHLHAFSGATGGVNQNHYHSFDTGGAGGGGAHSHTMDMRVTYIDVIVCSRN